VRTGPARIAAAAGLAALRAEYAGLAWHTLGGHFNDSRAFWAAVGAGVPGGYQQRDVTRTSAHEADARAHGRVHPPRGTELPAVVRVGWCEHDASNHHAWRPAHPTA
jgi:hypothetical protein